MDVVRMTASIVSRRPKDFQNKREVHKKYYYRIWSYNWTLNNSAIFMMKNRSSENWIIIYLVKIETLFVKFIKYSIDYEYLMFDSRCWDRLLNLLKLPTPTHSIGIFSKQYEIKDSYTPKSNRCLPASITSNRQPIPLLT